MSVEWRCVWETKDLNFPYHTERTYMIMSSKVKSHCLVPHHELDINEFAIRPKGWCEKQFQDIQFWGSIPLIECSGGGTVRWVSLVMSTSNSAWDKKWKQKRVARFLSELLTEKLIEEK